MPRKKPPFQVRRVYVSDPDPEAKRRIHQDLTGCLRPPLSRDDVNTRLAKIERMRARRQLSAAAFAKEYEALCAEARCHPRDFWNELESAFLTYWRQARLRPEHRAVTARLRYVEKALAALEPQTRLKSSRENLAKAIDRTGVMPWEDCESPSLPRVMLARIIAERATKDHTTFRVYLTAERARLKNHQRALEKQAGPYLGKHLRRGKRSALALREFTLTVKALLTRYLAGRFRWADVIAVFKYFHPARLKPPTLTEPNDPHEALDDAFWFSTKDTLRRLIRRP